MSTYIYTDLNFYTSLLETGPPYSMERNRIGTEREQNGTIPHYFMDSKFNLIKALRMCTQLLSAHGFISPQHTIFFFERERMAKVLCLYLSADCAGTELLNHLENPPPCTGKATNKPKIIYNESA